MRLSIAIASTAVLLTPLVNSEAAECASSPPASVLHEISLRLPHWRIVTVADLSPDDRQLWSEHHPGECPGFVEGRFTGSRNSSFAVTVIREGEHGLEQMLVLGEPARSSYRLRTLSGASQAAVPNVLLRFPPGQYRDAMRQRSMRCRFDAIAYLKLEASGSLYCRATTGFVRLDISE
jgi:hypothetical protein